MVVTVLDSRLPLTIRPILGGFAIVFADGGQHILVEGDNLLTENRVGDELTSEEAFDLAREIARALAAAWGDPLRSAA